MIETEIARRLGISRTPVREAIRRLESDGLIVHAPRVGALVRSLDYSEITELYEMRTVLEGTAARLAARSASEIELSEIEAINDEMSRAVEDVARLDDLNRHFHQSILNSARNRYLAQSIAGLQKTLIIIGPSTMEEAGRAAAAIEEHEEILRALRARDDAAAESAMRRHIQSAHGMRLRQLRDRLATGDEA